MELSAENYYSQDANQEYMSVSQFKNFVGTEGRSACEFKAMEELTGRWEEETTIPMLVGSYVDSYFESPESHTRFKTEHPELFKRDGGLKADYVKAEEIIKRIESDQYFMRFMSGAKQVIMTGDLFGAKWKIRMDSYFPDEAIVDMKIVKAAHGREAFEWVKDYGYTYFPLVWGYDIQGAVYQEIVRQNTGKKLPFYLAVATKQKEPDIEIIQITQNYLDHALSFVERNMPRVIKIKNGEEEPERCGVCDCCRKNKVLTSPIPILDVPDSF